MKRILILLAAIAPALAEDHFDDQLTRAERTFERQTAAALLAEYERYGSELVALERTLVAGEDFEGAASVQATRLEIQSLIATAKKPASSKRRTHTFKKGNATSSGNTLTWTPNTPITPGGYKIALEPESAKAIISEGFHTAKPGQTLRISTGTTISIALPSGVEFAQLTLTPGA